MQTVSSKIWTRVTVSISYDGIHYTKIYNQYVSERFGSVWFGLVWFYGIANIVGYLMPNPFLYI